MVPVANPVPNIRNISSVENAHKPLVYIDQRIQLNRYMFVGIFAALSIENNKRNQIVF